MPKIKPITLALVSALAITLTYTSCKKSETAGSKSNIDKKDFSLKLVKNFNDSFTGNLNSSQTNNTSKQRVNSPNSCDIPYTQQVNDSITVVAAETSYKAKGYITLTTLCTEDQWTAIGYKLVDSISSVSLNIASETRAVVKENYTAITPTIGTYGTVKCNGTQVSHIVVINKAANPVQTVDQTNNFILQDLLVTARDGNGAPRIQSGTAIFNVHGFINSPGDLYNYTGTITFLGNNIARVAYNTEVYIVDLNTGIVTKQ